MAMTFLGVKTIKFGTCGANGTMGTILTQILHIVEDSAIFSSDDDVFYENNVEELNYPVDLVPVNQGNAQLAFSTKDVDPAKLLLLKGGTVTGGTSWAAPTDPTLIVGSLEVVTKATNFSPNGMKLQIPRAQLKVKFGLGMKKTEAGKIDVIAVTLQPLDAGNNQLSAYTYIKL
jgi:hypothetical protein